MISTSNEPRSSTGAVTRVEISLKNTKFIIKKEEMVVKKWSA